MSNGNVKSSFLTHRKLTIPAGGRTVPIQAFGKVCMITEAPLKFEMRFDGSDWFQAFVGLRWNLLAGDTFKTLDFRNTHPTEDIEVEFLYGQAEVEDMRLNIVRGRVAPMMHAETVVTGHSATIPANDEIDLSAVAPPVAGYIRKATVVTNMDPAVDLELANEDDEVFASVLFRTSYLVESSAPVKVVNNTASPVVCRVGQIWYVIN